MTGKVLFSKEEAAALRFLASVYGDTSLAIRRAVMAEAQRLREKAKQAAAEGGGSE